MRRLSAWEALTAWRDAERSRESAAETALWRNACLLSRAVFRDGKRAFADGKAVLAALPPETVACWARAYERLCAAPGDAFDGWQERKKQLAADAPGRLRWRVGRLMGLSPRMAERMSDAQVRDRALELILDQEEALAGLCPSCREAALSSRCPICGSESFGENAAFDEERFEELKHHGLSDENA